MTEIRPIKEAEATTFLALLCDVFKLQLPGAEGVFFHEPFYDLSRKWGLFEDGDLRSILTTTPLLFGWGRGFGIAGVATDVRHQGRGLASDLLREVLRAAEQDGETPALLFAHQPDLYQRLGFEVLDQVVRAPIAIDDHPGEVEIIGLDEVQACYAAWASESPDRLIRDERRWRYWQWVYRPCEALGDGYLCTEPALIREAIGTIGLKSLPVPPSSEWFGLDSMRKSLAIPTTAPGVPELTLMGRAFPSIPQMFMTDQF